MLAKTFDLKKFKAWLTARGAIVDPPTNEWEILRVRTSEGLFVAYRNKAGKETWPDGLMTIREAFVAGQEVPLSPDLKSRVKLRHQVEALAARDGLECWFCERGFLNVESVEITIEHLVPICHGGPNHPSNLVLACKPCNSAAGNLSVAEKVRLREKERAA